MDKSIVHNIKLTLADLERQREIKILHAIESGSRGWGFPSIDSDYDCRFIYRQTVDNYLSITELKDYIEIPVDEVYDVNGWDLKKVLLHIQKSNPTIWEWLQSPVIYYVNREFVAESLILAKEYYNEKVALYHYRSLAKKKLDQITQSKMGKLKAYFYAFRSTLACDYMMTHHCIPPMEIEKLMQGVHLEKELIDEIRRLIILKRDIDEDYTLEQNRMILNYVESKIKACEVYILTIEKSESKSEDKLNMFFRKWVQKNL